MPEHRMESAYPVNSARHSESAIHDEVYSPSSRWTSFERLSTQTENNDRSHNCLDMSASDPYQTDTSMVKAPAIGNSTRPDFRQDRQEHAIFDGVKSGEIDFDEYTNLQQEQNLIERAQQYFGANGLSEQELRHLDMLQNSARQHIIDAGGCDEMKYGNEEKQEHRGEKERGGEKEHGGGKEHGGHETAEAQEKPEEEITAEESAPAESPQDQFKDFMNFLDQNSDGQITLEELLQAFEAMDADGDGVVSPEEFQKFMEKLASQGPKKEESPGGKEHSGGAEEHGAEATPKNETPVEEAPVQEEKQNDRTDSTNANSDSGTAKLIYIFPESQDTWQKINSDAPEGSLIVTLPSKDVSWDSDKPFNALDPALQENIAQASERGLNPLGYVGTRGGTRPIEEVKAEIDSWYAHSDVRGIYLGDSGDHNGSGYATDERSEAYFKEIGNYIKSKGGIAAINGGATPNRDYMDTFDIQGTYEGYADAYSNQPRSADWQGDYSPDRFAAMLVGVQQSDIARAESMARANHNGFIFIAPDYGIPGTSSNSYWNEVIDQLDGVRGNQS